MRTRSLAVVFGLVTILGIYAPQPAAAISDGVPDTQHPNVGAMLVEADPVNLPGQLLTWCSGALLGPRYFVTAAHCILFLHEFLPPGIGPENVFVTFDQEALAGAVIGVTDITVHPDYIQRFRGANANDIAVLTLAHEVDGIDPIQLPTQGFLDQASQQNALKGHLFTNVGYGFVPTQTGPPGFSDDGIRRVSTSPYLGLTQDWLIVSMNTNATSLGGICAGDSGSPKFFEPAGEPGGNLAVAITTGGDPTCRSYNANQRLDIPSIRAFLSNFVTLP
jgi:secreted trypsin-like serine protease